MSQQSLYEPRVVRIAACLRVAFPHLDLTTSERMALTLAGMYGLYVPPNEEEIRAAHERQKKAKGRIKFGWSDKAEREMLKNAQPEAALPPIVTPDGLRAPVGSVTFGGFDPEFACKECRKPCIKAASKLCRNCALKRGGKSTKKVRHFVSRRAGTKKGVNRKKK